MQAGTTVRDVHRARSILEWTMKSGNLTLQLRTLDKIGRGVER